MVSCPSLRDEQYRALWSELDSLAETFSANSEQHRKLAEFVSQATSHAPSMQSTRKTPPLRSGGPLLLASQPASQSACSLSPQYRGSG